MLYKTTLFIFALVFTLSAQTSQTDCNLVAKLKLGNKFYQLDKSTIHKEISAELERLGANQVDAKYVKHMHPKLGPSYSVEADIYKCK